MTGAALDLIARTLDLGGPVIAILMLASVAVLAVTLFKVWQFAAAGVGRHTALRAAVAAMDAGDRVRAQQSVAASRSYLAAVFSLALEGTRGDRLRAEVDARIGRLERGFRLLDTVAQLAPLLGLFGTVLGMIEAFQALQQAGSAVDPSLLAGGIWTALLTTAAGLVVAMPAALVLSWLEGRIEADRAFADHALSVLRAPVDAAVPEGKPVAGLAHV